MRIIDILTENSLFLFKLSLFDRYQTWGLINTPAALMPLMQQYPARARSATLHHGCLSLTLSDSQLTLFP